jgi:hypothetical protein
MNDQRKTFIAFSKLGDFLREFCNSKEIDSNWSAVFNEAIRIAKHHNGWFTEENVLFALKGWGELLTEEKLDTWLSNYQLKTKQSITVVAIMAGNIPLVGFHDFVSVLISGNKFMGKLSSNDKTLLPLIANFLIETEPSLNGRITFTEEKLENFDAIIATGSNNTARYFEHYFSKGPHIIRKNRNSVAVLSGNESNEELEALGEDIFRYFGLGCRSVSKLFVPNGYDFDTFFKAIFKYNGIIQLAKYANNYDYNKAVYLMSEFKILDNGFLLLKQDESFGSPIATLFFEYYSSHEELKNKLKLQAENIQCIVAKDFIENEIPFGKTQSPALNDYADGIDTVDFLLKTSQI